MRRAAGPPGTGTRPAWIRHLGKVLKLFQWGNLPRRIEAGMGWVSHDHGWSCGLPDGTRIDVLPVDSGWGWEHVRPPRPVPPTAAGAAGMTETLGDGGPLASAHEALLDAMTYGLARGYTP